MTNSLVDTINMCGELFSLINGFREREIWAIRKSKDSENTPLTKEEAERINEYNEADNKVNEVSRYLRFVYNGDR